MRVKETNLKDYFIVKLRVFSKERRSFFESFRKQKPEKEIGSEFNFIKKKSILILKRVFKLIPVNKIMYSQAKLVRVYQGKGLNLALVIRELLETLGEYFLINKVLNFYKK